MIESLFIRDLSLNIHGSEQSISLLSKIITPSIFWMGLDMRSHIHNIKDLVFEGDSDSMCCFFDKDILFSFYYDQDLDGLVCETDEDSPTKLVTVKEMMVFPSFIPLVECELCEGKGWYTEIDCSVGSASECCGGCEVRHECECEGVLFENLD
jgi:hypothetical protein